MDEVGYSVLELVKNVETRNLIKKLIFYKYQLFKTGNPIYIDVINMTIFMINILGYKKNTEKIFGLSSMYKIRDKNNEKISKLKTDNFYINNEELYDQALHLCNIGVIDLNFWEKYKVDILVIQPYGDKKLRNFNSIKNFLADNDKSCFIFHCYELMLQKIFIDKTNIDSSENIIEIISEIKFDDFDFFKTNFKLVSSVLKRLIKNKIIHFEPPNYISKQDIIDKIKENNSIVDNEMKESKKNKINEKNEESFPKSLENIENFIINVEKWKKNNEKNLYTNFNCSLSQFYRENKNDLNFNHEKTENNNNDGTNIKFNYNNYNETSKKFEIIPNYSCLLNNDVNINEHFLKNKFSKIEEFKNVHESMNNNTIETKFEWNSLYDLEKILLG